MRGRTEGVVDASVALGFLTARSPVLMDAPAPGVQVGLPFASGGVRFREEREMTRRVAGLGKVMLKHRLTPPPEASRCTELSGCFLTCMRIGTRSGRGRCSWR